MATRKITESSPALQTQGLTERLIRHADNIRNPAAAATMGADMREAAGLIEAWRVGIAGAIVATEDDATRDHLSRLLEGN
jgi:hypothetical protein